MVEGVAGFRGREVGAVGIALPALGFLGLLDPLGCLLAVFGTWTQSPGAAGAESSLGRLLLVLHLRKGTISGNTGPDRASYARTTQILAIGFRWIGPGLLGVTGTAGLARSTLRHEGLLEAQP